MGEIFAAIAGLIHVYIFVMESLLWGTPKINKVFNVTKEMAEANQAFAFNQGFYNLFLAMAVISGIALKMGGHSLVGKTLITYACLSMVGAALVLVYSNKQLLRAACIQGVMPALGTVFLWL